MKKVTKQEVHLGGNTWDYNQKAENSGGKVGLQVENDKTSSSHTSCRRKRETTMRRITR